jgi:hypothetical protein
MTDKTVKVLVTAIVATAIGWAIIHHRSHDPEGSEA